VADCTTAAAAAAAGVGASAGAGGWQLEMCGVSHSIQPQQHGNSASEELALLHATNRMCSALGDGTIAPGVQACVQLAAAAHRLVTAPSSALGTSLTRAYAVLCCCRACCWWQCTAGSAQLHHQQQ
jgi:hypothetical protein